MSGWGNFWRGGGRFSPFGTAAYPPKVSDDDYSYITADDLASQTRPYDTHPPPRPPVPRPVTDDDVIILRSRGASLPLHFHPYSIDDGHLKVGDLRRAAANVLRVPDLSRLKLLYKGRPLKDELKPCRDEGLKINSEVLAVYSDDVDDVSQSTRQGSETGQNEESGSDETDSTPPGGDGPSKKKRNRNRKRKNKKGGSSAGADLNPNLAPPGGRSGGPSRSTSPAPPPAPKTAREKLDELSSHFSTKLLPQCVQFTSNPPSDPAKCEFEHRKLTETILSEVLLKLDAVETEGDPEARQRRRDLVKQAQGVLSGLDAVKDGRA